VNSQSGPNVNSGDDRLRDLLSLLRDTLRENDSLTDHYAEQIDAALAGDDAALEAFLVSNLLWGGMGSMPDEAGLNWGREARRPIEAAFVALGEEQLRCGIVNPRTAHWVSAFRDWQEHGG